MRKTLPVVIACAMVVSAGCSSAHRGLVSSLPDPTMIPHRRATVPRAPLARAERAATPKRNPYPRAVGLPRGVDLPGGVRRNWQYIIIHHSASDRGNAGQFDRFHRMERGWNELGYHFVIGNGRGSGDGEIEVGPRWRKQKHGAHCKTPDNRYNDFGIGVCLVGNFQDRGHPTPAQMRSLAGLVDHLRQVCNIPLQDIYKHGAVTHKTACPGRNFSLEHLKMMLGGVAYR